MDTAATTNDLPTNTIPAGPMLMNAAGRSRIIEVPTAHATLMDLCRPFLVPPEAGGAPFEPECAVVQPEEIPEPADQLLVHHEHMTVALQKFHGSPVEVRVREEHLSDDGGFYTRMISLAPAAQPGRVVELGIVQLDFRYMDAAVRDEILKKQLPLGAILIKHDVHRRVKPRFFLRFPPNGPVLRLLGTTEPWPVYGRLGTIYCDDEPAIELLEIVTGIEPTA